jgi:hypothetical protein
MIHILTRLDAGNEMTRMQMLRRRDQDGIDGLILQQLAEIPISPGCGGKSLRLVQTPGIRIGDANGLDPGTAEGIAEYLPSARPGTNQADANAVVGS